jgi:hypothetical protein
MKTLNLLGEAALLHIGGAPQLPLLHGCPATHFVLKAIAAGIEVTVESGFSGVVADGFIVGTQSPFLIFDRPLGPESKTGAVQPLSGSHEARNLRPRVCADW